MDAAVLTLSSLFPKVDVRILRASLLEHGTDAKGVEDAAAYIMDEVLSESEGENEEESEGGIEGESDGESERESEGEVERGSEEENKSGNHEGLLTEENRDMEYITEAVYHQALEEEALVKTAPLAADIPASQPLPSVLTPVPSAAHPASSSMPLMQEGPALVVSPPAAFFAANPVPSLFEQSSCESSSGEPSSTGPSWTEDGDVHASNNLLNASDASDPQVAPMLPASSGTFGKEGLHIEEVQQSSEVVFQQAGGLMDGGLNNAEQDVGKSVGDGELGEEGKGGKLEDGSGEAFLLSEASKVDGMAPLSIDSFDSVQFLAAELEHAKLMEQPADVSEAVADDDLVLADEDVGPADVTKVGDEINADPVEVDCGVADEGQEEAQSEAKSENAMATSTLAKSWAMIFVSPDVADISEKIQASVSGKEALNRMLADVKKMAADAEASEEAARLAEVRAEVAGAEELRKAEDLRRTVQNSASVMQTRASEICGHRRVLHGDADGLRGRLAEMDGEMGELKDVLDGFMRQLLDRTAAAKAARQKWERLAREKEERAAAEKAAAAEELERLACEHASLQDAERVCANLSDFLKEQEGLADRLKGQLSVLKEDVELLVAAVEKNLGDLAGSSATMSSAAGEGATSDPTAKVSDAQVAVGAAVDGDFVASPNASVMFESAHGMLLPAMASGDEEGLMGLEAYAKPSTDDGWGGALLGMEGGPSVPFGAGSEFIATMEMMDRNDPSCRNGKSSNQLFPLNAFAVRVNDKMEPTSEVSDLKGGEWEVLNGDSTSSSSCSSTHHSNA